MKIYQMTTNDKIEFLNIFHTSKTVRSETVIALCEKYNIKPRTVYDWVQAFSDEITPEPEQEPETILEKVMSKETRTLNRLTDENKQLKKALEDAKKHIYSASDYKDLIYGCKAEGFNTIPTWLNNKNDASKTNKLVPVLFLTDIHLGEVVNARDMGFTEEYNTEVAINSVNRVTEDFIDICKNKMSNYTYDGVVLMLGGDGITGNLHDLAETNDSTPTRQVIDLTSLYIQQIRKLEEHFGKVAVFGVTGNHGRFDGHNYTKTKRRSENSLETIVYDNTGSFFKNNPNVNVITDESDEILFGINGRKFLLTHGDRGMRGGNGVGGIIVPIKRARAKMLQSAVAMRKEFHTLVIGHFHQHFISDDLIIGASTKPFDEYCKSMGFEYNSAGATSFFVNSHGDIIFSTKLIIRDENKKIDVKKKTIELF